MFTLKYSLTKRHLKDRCEREQDEMRGNGGRTEREWMKASAKQHKKETHERERKVESCENGIVFECDKCKSGNIYLHLDFRQFSLNSDWMF